MKRFKNNPQKPVVKTLALLLGISASAVVVQAQSIGPSTLNAAGGSRVIGGNSYEWSVGEMAVVSTFSNASLVVTQGVLQPNMVSNAVGNVPGKITALNVYPNPVADGQLYLSPSFNNGGKLIYRLTDAAGKTVLSQTSTLQSGKELQTISMHAYAAGQYTLSVEWQDSKGTSFNNYKIQKTH